MREVLLYLGGRGVAVAPFFLILQLHVPHFLVSARHIGGSVTSTKVLARVYCGI
jgi:hypothetical protein